MARDKGSFDSSTGSRGLMLTLDTRDVYVVPLATVTQSVVMLREDRVFFGFGGGKGSLQSCLVCAFCSGVGFCPLERYVVGMVYVKPAPLEMVLLSSRIGF